MWTTPGSRPLAEQSTFDWDEILEREFSEPKLNALFAGIPEKQCRAKDLREEAIALGEYIQWLSTMWTPDLSGLCSDNPRAELYKQLHGDVGYEYDRVYKEWNDLLDTATRLGGWEYMYLDRDGKTTGIQHDLRQGKDVFRSNNEARAKYGHLAPTRNGATPLGFFEYEWLDENGVTTKLEKELKRGHNRLQKEAEEVRTKYRYLAPTGYDATPLGMFEYMLTDEDGGTKKLESAWRNRLSGGGGEAKVWSSKSSVPGQGG